MRFFFISGTEGMFDTFRLLYACIYAAIMQVYYNAAMHTCMYVPSWLCLLVCTVI
jgi:hypothetical protein